MAQLLTLPSDAWRVMRSRLQKQDSVAIHLRLDRSGPGSHLVWDIANVGTDPITVTRLVVHSRTGPTTVPLGMAQVLNSQEHTRLPTDVDWPLLSATSLSVCDAAGGEHLVPQKQLQLIRGAARHAHRAPTLHAVGEGLVERRHRPRHRRGDPRARLFHADVGDRSG